MGYADYFSVYPCILMENIMEDKNNIQNNSDDKEKATDKSVFEVVREQQKQRRLEQLKFESQMTEKIADEQAKQRRTYEKQLHNEKIELIRMKQGEVKESDIIPVNQQDAVIELTFWGKISNFIYHNKWWLGIGVILAIIAGILIYDLATKKNPDVIVLMFEDNEEIGRNLELNNYIQQFCEDFNGDGEILSDVYYIPYTGNETADYSSGTSTKIVAEMQSAEAVIIIGHKKLENAIVPENTLTDLEKLYPDNPYVKEYGFYLRDTDLAEKINYSGKIDSDVYLGIRKPKEVAWASQEEMQEVYDKGIIVFDRIIEDLS